MRYKSGAFGESNTAVGYTDAGIATDATYAEMLTAFNNLLATEGAPITIYATRTEVSARSGLLSDYPGAAAAYSLRQLDTDYAGSAIRVRRASDNAEQDIGFDGNGDLDTTALATFCSGTDGFVKTWYDQSGNANDATQTTTSLQPFVYYLDSVQVVNGRPAIRQLGSTASELPVSFDFNDLHTSNECAALQITTGSGQMSFGLSGNTAFGIHGAWSAGLRYFNVPTTNQATATNANQSIVFGNRTGNTVTLHENAVQIKSVTDVADISTGTANFIHRARFTAYHQETIWWNSEQSSNRQGIESNINTYYSIYP